MLYLSREEVGALLTLDECMELCEETFRLRAQGQTAEVPRFQFDLEDRYWLAFMPAMIKSKGVIGLRIFGGRPRRQLYILWEAQDGTPLAMMDAMMIQDMRTAAIGAIGAKYMARADAHRVAMLGSGTQARSALVAHMLVRRLTQVKVYSPTKEHREAFAREMGAQLGLAVEAADSPEGAVADADIVITGSNISTPQEPVLRGAWLRPGTHISSVGGRAELDDEVVARAAKVVIDTKAQFPHEVTDVTAQVKKGIITWDQVVEIHEVVAGLKPGREGPDEITLLKTVGSPLQDLLSAARAYALAVEKGVGKDLGDIFPPAPGWYQRVQTTA